MTGWVDEVYTAVNTGVLDVTVPLRGKLFTKVGAVLVFDVFDDWVPAVKNKNRLNWPNLRGNRRKRTIPRY